MKSATFSKSAFAVTAILVATACAESAGAPEGDLTPTETAPIAATPTPSKPPTPVEKKCAPSCKTDSDCNASCPSLADGVQCCDVKSGVCFGSKTSACPVAQPEPVDPPPAY